MLEPIEAFKIFEIDYLPFVTGSKTAVIAAFIWTLIEDSLQCLGYTDIIAPINACFKERFLLAHYFPSVELDFIREVFLVKFHCDSSTFLKININLAIFVDSNVGQVQTIMSKFLLLQI